MEEKKPSDRAGWMAILVFGVLMILSGVLSMCTHKAHAQEYLPIGSYGILCSMDADTPRDIARAAAKSHLSIREIYDNRKMRAWIKSLCSFVSFKEDDPQDLFIFKSSATLSSGFKLVEVTLPNDDRQEVQYLLLGPSGH